MHLNETHTYEHDICTHLRSSVYIQLQLDPPTLTINITYVRTRQKQSQLHSNNPPIVLRAKYCHHHLHKFKIHLPTIASLKDPKSTATGFTRVDHMGNVLTPRLEVSLEVNNTILISQSHHRYSQIHTATHPCPYRYRHPILTFRISQSP